ncbi:uncharacterized protein DUF3106 [Desulfosoma caldarium]|uniref:Uncharacterized protein DUF3106 n=1 Tax=Desulfosoma caldarium TaxID=610254 RepID=A0A3N1UPW2_9BACT|nr:DUF3106 domain-containing protein [Desulfosoma caldarium]ROQ93175.1 uncharacterized protein DUF3106 [Desulfosoma caldarium]
MLKRARLSRTLNALGASSSSITARRIGLLLFLGALLLGSAPWTWAVTPRAFASFREGSASGSFVPSRPQFYAKGHDDEKRTSNPFDPFQNASKAPPQYREWQSLPPQQKDVFRRRLKEYKSLPPQQQQLYKKRWQQWQQISPEERRRVESDLQRWNELSPERREAIRRLFNR